MAIQLTQGSAIEYENILFGNMTPKMAAEYLRQENISIRSFSDTLRQMYPENDISQRLENFYYDICPGENRKSVKRKIFNWLNGRNVPKNREDSFRIAFALGLTEERLNFLLGLCTDYGIQYRDGREVVLAWFLRNEYSYTEAEEFLTTLPPVNPDFSVGGGDGSDPRFFSLYDYKYFHLPYPEKEEISDNDDLVKSWRKHIIPFGRGYTNASRITHEIRNDFQMVRDKEELRSCYLANLNMFGHMHLRSYYYFMQYLRQLIQPFSLSGEDEIDYSIETVMNTYLSMHMPIGKKTSSYTVVQKLLKNNWPNTTSIRSILNRAEDVPRKLILLLYVVTENTDYRNDYSELDEEYISLEERVEDHWWTLNALLTECGMATLDLRNVFDWLILYAVSSDKEESMSSRLEGVIDELYNDVSEDSFQEEVLSTT